MVKNWHKQRLAKSLPQLRFPQLELSPSRAIHISPDSWAQMSGREWPKTAHGPAAGLAVGSVALVNSKIAPIRKSSIAAHEEMHALLFQVETSYGAPAKKRLVKSLLDHVSPIARQYLYESLGQFGYNLSKKDTIQEEMLVYLHTYQTDPVNRARINAALGSRTKASFFAKAANESWTAIIRASQSVTPSDLLGEPVKKNIPDDDLRSISALQHDNNAANVVDASYHHETSHAPTKFPNFLKADKKEYPRGVSAGGVTSKKLYGHGKDVYMVKNYHQAHKHFDYALGNRSPISGGWATMANAGLYGAAKIPHLNEDVAVHKQKEKYLVLHKFAPGYKTTFEMRDELPRTVAANDLVKIAAMDFLSNNQDRHADNILVHPDGHVKAIDHERSFQYHKNHKDLKTLHDYFIRSGLGMLHAPNGGLDLGDVAGWWKDNSENVSNEMEKHLIAIKDEGIRGHIRQNFRLRHSLMDEWAQDVMNQSRDHFRPRGLHSSEASIISMPVDHFKIRKMIQQAGGMKDPVTTVHTIAKAVNGKAFLSPSQTKNIGAALQEVVDNLDKNQAKALYAHMTENPAYNNGNMANIGLQEMLLHSVANRKDGTEHASAILDHIRSLDHEARKGLSHHASRLRAAINEGQS